jgi:hypothetical protein
MHLQKNVFWHRFRFQNFWLKRFTCDFEYTAQFHSIRHGLWPVTQNTDSALRQPMKFGVTPPKIRHSRRKFSKILPFLHLWGRFGPDVTHFTFGTGCRDPWPRPKFIAAQGVRDTWPPNWMKLRSSWGLHKPTNFDLLCAQVWLSWSTWVHVGLRRLTPSRLLTHTGCHIPTKSILYWDRDIRVNCHKLAEVSCQWAEDWQPWPMGCFIKKYQDMPSLRSGRSADCGMFEGTHPSDWNTVPQAQQYKKDLWSVKAFFQKKWFIHSRYLHRKICAINQVSL